MRVLYIAGVAAFYAVAACDFGTLDALSEDDAVHGTDEVSTQALKIWSAYDKTDDDAKSGVADINGVVQRAGAIPVQVTIDNLTKANLGLTAFNLSPRDPATAQGMLLISVLNGCSLDALTKLVVAKNQPDLYPKTYDAYTRTYDANANDFLSGITNVLTWKTDYQATAIGHTYKSTLGGGARRVLGAGPNGSTVLFSRTILLSPATFNAGDDAAFNQDYQIEAYYESAPNTVTHYYALWREFRISDLTSQSNLYINVVLGNLADFDVRTAKVCRDNAPLPAFQ